MLLFLFMQIYYFCKTNLDVVDFSANNMVCCVNLTDNGDERKNSMVLQELW